MDIGRQAMGGMAVRVIGLTLTWATTMCLAHALGPGQYGVWTVIVGLSSLLATVFSFGADQFATRTIASTHQNDSTDLRREACLTHAICLSGTVIGLVVLLGTLCLAGVFNFSLRLQLVLTASLMMFPVIQLIVLRQWITLPLLGTAAAIAPEQILLPLLLIPAVTVLKSVNGSVSVNATVMAYAVCSLTVWAVAMWTSRIGRLIHSGLRDRFEFREILGRVAQAAPFLGSSLVNLIAQVRLMPLVVAAVCGFEDAGRLAVALQMATLVAMPLGVVTLSVMPGCARLHGAGDHEALQHLIRSAATLCVCLAPPIAIGLLVFRNSLFALLGTEYSPSAQLLIVLVIGQLFNACCGPNGAVMQMIGMERVYMKALLVTGVGQMIAVAAAGMAGNLIAVAIAIAASQFASNIVLCLILWRRRRLPLLPYASPSRWFAALRHV